MLESGGISPDFSSREAGESLIVLIFSQEWGPNTPMSSRSFRKNRKSGWKRRVLFLLLAVAAVFGGYLYLWKPIVAWFQPRIQIVESQKEAMDKLNSIMVIWDGNTEKLQQTALNKDQLFAWMKDGNARESVNWLLAQELGVRGKWKEAHAMLLPLLEKQMKSLGSLPGENHDLAMKRCYDAAVLMQKRGDADNAEKLLDFIIEQGDGGDVDTYIAVIKLSSDIKAKAGRLKEAAGLVEKITTDRVWNKIHKDESVKDAVRLLLLSDSAQPADGGELPTKGRKLAWELLNRSRMTICPEMGIVLLSDIYIPYSRENLTPDEVDAISSSLEKALVCFRASDADMTYIPEIMVGLARMELLKSRSGEASLWLDRAEGAAMTLGVDQPRILAGQSIKQDIGFLRSEIARVADAHQMLSDIEKKLNDADTYISNKAWGLADSTLRDARDMIQKHTVFARGYMPVCLAKRARMYAGQEKWEEASATYERLLADWNALSDEEKQILNSNLKAFGVSGLYETIHKDFASICLKLNRITRSRQLLQAIGSENASSSR